MDFFAVAAKGTEGVLRDELTRLRFEGVRATRGGVHFRGSIGEGYRACLWSAVAVRVLLTIDSFACPDADALYAGVHAHDFSNVLSDAQTLAVGAAGRAQGLTHTEFIAQRTKDAIVDRLRERFGVRPSVDKRDPDVLFFVHIANDRATLYLDLGGEPLHRRGYRTGAGEAPLKETLAAAIVRLAGYDGELPFFDPMCGSGTLLIEAALIARNRAPGLGRKRFGFERWRDFGADNARLIADLRARALDSQRAAPAPILGADVSGAVLEQARANAATIGVELGLKEGAMRDARPEFPRGVLATNPPYGERLARPPELARELARLVDRFYRWNAVLFMKSDEPLGRTRRKPRLYTLFNGPIECHLRRYDAVDTEEPQAPR